MKENTPTLNVRPHSLCGDLGSQFLRSQAFEQLETLLAEGADGARERERCAFDQLASSYANTVVLLGAGGLGRRTLAGLRKRGMEPIEQGM